MATVAGEAQAQAGRQAEPGGAPVFAPSDLAISARGRRFIYDHERLGTFSRRLYWPKGASGVTLGAGFDMRDRGEREIADDLEAIGVEPEVAAHAARGSHLTGAAAQLFAHNNHGLIFLTSEQELGLMEWILPHYVAMVRRRLRRSLTQAQFDALVSYAYNPGTGAAWRAVLAHVNAGEDDDAMQEISRQVTSRHKVVPSLVERRRDEVRLYRTGDYGAVRR